MSPEDALKKLMEGNSRFVEGRMLYANHSEERREAVKGQQYPYAIVVGCSDSRSIPEIIFDQGIGDLFVVRVAGNVIGASMLDSITYAVLQLHASLILILGHESCGAVTAVLTGQTSTIPTVAQLIQESYTGTPDLKEAIHENIHHGIQIVKNSPNLSPLFEQKKLLVVGGYYNLQSGKVDLLSPF